MKDLDLDLPESSDGATVQMSAEQMAKLHAELARTGAIPKEDRSVSGTAPTEEPRVLTDDDLDAGADLDVEPEPEPVPAPRAPKPAAKIEKAAKPDKVEKVAAKKPERVAPPPKPAPASAPEVAYDASQAGGGLCAIGGIGAVLSAVLAGLGIALLFVDLDFDAQTSILITHGTMALAHLLLFLGMLGAARATNGLGVLVGMFHLLTGLLFAFYLLVAFQVIPIADQDLDEVLLLLTMLLPATTWLLSGIWGFSTGRAIGGAMAGLYGTFALIAGATSLTMTILSLSRSLDADLAQILGPVALGALLVASVLLMLAMFGGLRRGPAAVDDAYTM